MIPTERIQAFLARKRFAVIGVSRNPQDFSRKLFSSLRERGYDVVPVNPAVEQVGDLHCYAHVGDIQPPVDAALLMTSPQQTDEVVRECAKAGVTFIWFFKGGAPGAATPEAIRFCNQEEIDIIPGECPYMFLPHSGFPHNFHHWIRRAFAFG